MRTRKVGMKRELQSREPKEDKSAFFELLSTTFRGVTRPLIETEPRPRPYSFILAPTPLLAEKLRAGAKRMWW